MFFPTVIKSVLTCLITLGLVCAAQAQESSFSSENFSSDFAPLQKPQAKEKQLSDEKLEKKRADELKAELTEKITGVWAIVTSADKPLSLEVVEKGAKRCLQPMELKALQFEKSAEKTLPDISSLFGDVVYFPTDTGLQRLDIKSSAVLLMRDVEKFQISGDQYLWKLNSERISLRVRFSRIINAETNFRFMLEEGNLYLRCPIKVDSF